MGSSFFWDVTQHRLTFIDVSGQIIGSVFKGQAVQEDCGKDLGQMLTGRGDSAVSRGPACIKRGADEVQELLYA